MQNDNKTPPPKAGVYPGVAFDEYLQWDAFSQSQVLPMLLSPAHWQAYTSRKLDTEALRIGSLTDSMLFEPQAVSAEYTIRPATYPAKNGDEKPWNGNATWCREWLADAHDMGLPVISPAEYLESETLVKSVRAHRAASKLLAGANGQSQLSIVWRDEETGVLCKGRIDWLPDEGPICDLKTCRNGSGSPKNWPRHAWTYGYDIQAAMYTDGWQELNPDDPRAFAFIVAEKGAPHAVAVRTPQAATLDVGRSRYLKALRKYAECQASGEWPAYSQFAEPFDLAEWAIKSELNEMEITDGTGI